MGIQDRDYMRGSPEKRRQNSDQRLEAFFSGMLHRHPRLPLMAGSLLVLLIVAAILIAVLTG